MESLVRPKKRIKSSQVFTDGIKALKTRPPTWEQWKQGDLVAEPPAVELMQRVKARLLGGEPELFDVDLEAACLTFFETSKTNAAEDKYYQRAVKFWAQQYGIGNALLALNRSVQINFSKFYSPPGSSRHTGVDVPHFTFNEPNLSKFYFERLPEAAFVAFRHLVAMASDDEYKDALLAFKKWSSGAPDEPLAALYTAFVFSEEQNLKEALFKREGLSRLWGVFSLPVNLSEAEAANALAPHKKSQNHIFYDHALTLVWRVGVEVLPLVLLRDPYDQEGQSQREWVRVLSVFVGEEPARAMSKYIALKSARSIFEGYFKRNPELGKKILAEVVAQGSKKECLVANEILTEL